MKTKLAIIFGICLCTVVNLSAQLATNWLPGRVLIKLIPDFSRPRVYALNQSSRTNNGTLLALNATNGATLGEITLGLSPTDMAITPAGDALYVIHSGSRTIAKVDLDSFTVVSLKPIAIPNTYGGTPLYVVAKDSNTLFYTDGAWGPGIYSFDYAAGTSLFVLDTGGNQRSGAGGLVLNRTGDTLYIWEQYGWHAGYGGSQITRFAVNPNTTITQVDAGAAQSRDPLDTPIFIDAAGLRVFNKLQMVSATNPAVVLSQFSENIYAISFDGSLAFGPTKIFSTQTGAALTNFNTSTTVQCLSPDQTRLFRYAPNTSDLFVHDMTLLAPVNGPAIQPTPEDGKVVGVAPSKLSWTVSPVALGYDVYFGTNMAQMESATTGSAQYYGRVVATSREVPQVLVPGVTYYWRVDTIGFNSTSKGATWSFTVSTLAVEPSQFSVYAIQGYNPATVSMSLSSAAQKAWTISVSNPDELSVSAVNGTSPSTVAVSFTTAGLPVGLYTNQISVTSEGLTVRVPVLLDIQPLNIVKMAADFERPYIYALQAPALSGQSGRLLFINTLTTNIDKVLPIGINPVDLAINHAEDRLYVASWSENATYVVDLASQTLLPPLQLGTDVYKINAGGPGRLVTEGLDQWIYARLVNSSDGSTLSSALLREGDGEFEPKGRYYYHSDNNISSASLQKYDVGSDSFSMVTAVGSHSYYGSRNLVMSADGSRLFWTGAAYTSDLNEIGYLGEEIYATTAHGDFALGSTRVFNVNNGQSIYTWPFTTSIIAVSGDQTKVLLYNSTTRRLKTIPMSDIANAPGPGLNPTPLDASVVNLPLASLNWTASPLALSYRVFFGTDASAVQAAGVSSPLCLGSTVSTSFVLPTLSAGVKYFWRVDSIGFSTTNSGPVWSFTTSPMTVTPQHWALKGVQGLPIPPQAMSVSAGSALNWTMSVAQSWITPSASQGATPSSVVLHFDTTSLPIGFSTNELTFVAGGVTLRMPVVVQIFNLAATKMVADPSRNMIYALHPGSGGVEDAFLVFLNTDTGTVETVLSIGSDATDLTVHPREDRVYVTNWRRGQTRVVDLKTRTQLAPLALGNDVYKINAGLTGQIVIEGQDQWIDMTLVDSTSSSTLARVMVREGDGECDPTGRYYYHVDNNSTGAGITKCDIGNHSFVSVASAGKHNGFGSRNLVMSLDGSRLFWTGAMYDSALNDFGVLGSEIYSCSTNGSIAFSAAQAYDTVAKQPIYNLPASSSVQVVDRNDQRLWYFDSQTARIESVPLLSVRSPCIVEQPPSSMQVAVGGSLYLPVTTMGVAPLAYQWTMAGTNLPGATNYFLSLNNILPSQEGDYRLVVSNPFNTVTSAVSHITVLVPPVITGQPFATNVAAGYPFTLAATAQGAGLEYGWIFKGSTIAGATSSSLTISNAQTINEGIYRVVVQNTAGSATSVVATVRILPTPASIVAGPAPLALLAGATARFTVSTVGSQPMSYQWFRGASSIPGATQPEFTIANVQTADAGNYRVVASNGSGSDSSAPASLTVTPSSPYFVALPEGGSRAAGTDYVLSGLARGSDPINYQWQRYGTNLPGAIQPSLVFSNMTFVDSGPYVLIAYSPLGATSSPPAQLVVTGRPPVFVEYPRSTTVPIGGITALNSRAEGPGQIQYQWYFQSNAIPGQVSNLFMLGPVTPESAGLYYVTAANGAGIVTSAVAKVTIIEGPTLTQSLTNSIVEIGATTVLSVEASGPGPFTYVWNFNSVRLPGQSSTLTLTNIQPSQSGIYRVYISNSKATVTCAARLSVVGRPFRVTAWGDNSSGQTNVPAGLTDAIMVAGGDFHSLALRHNGTLLAWGSNENQQTNVPATDFRAVSIACGAAHNLAILEDGSAIAWGRNDFGQVNVPVSAKNVVSVAAGDAHSLALVSTGTVLAWGDNTYGQVSRPLGLANISAISAGRFHNLALRQNGTVVGWGYNEFGQAAAPQSLGGVASIAAGYLHSAVLLSNGTVVVWGDNTFGQTNVPSGLNNVVAIAAGDFHTMALRKDGSILSWGDNSYQQSRPATGVAIASGYYHCLALVQPTALVQASKTKDGLVLTWDSTGTLQWSYTPNGPFIDLPCEGRSYTNKQLSNPPKFYRIRPQ